MHSIFPTLFELKHFFKKIIFISISTAVCLKELKIFVPEAVIMGNAATLTCQYDLDNVSPPDF